MPRGIARGSAARCADATGRPDAHRPRPATRTGRGDGAWPVCASTRERACHTARGYARAQGRRLHVCAPYAPMATPRTYHPEARAMRRDRRGVAQRVPRATIVWRQGARGERGGLGRGWKRGGRGGFRGRAHRAPLRSAAHACATRRVALHMAAIRAVVAQWATPLCIGTTQAHERAAAVWRGVCAPRRASAGDTPCVANARYQGVDHTNVRHARPWLRHAPAIRGAGRVVRSTRRGAACAASGNCARAEAHQVGGGVRAARPAYGIMGHAAHRCRAHVVQG